MGVNYYEVLNVNKNVSDFDLKVAYRKLARRWQADAFLNNRIEAEGKLKQIAEAYEVLSDPQKRAVYDQFGEDGLKGFAPRNALDLFGEFDDKPPFGLGSSDHTDFGSTSQSHNDAPITRKSPSFEEKWPCTLEQLYTGYTRQLQINRCVTDESGKVVKESKMLTVDVMPGWKNGTKLTYPGKGTQQKLNELPGDLVIIIDERPHERFKRDGDDLILNHTVSSAEAASGRTIVKFKTLDGRNLKIQVHDIIRPGYEHVIPNEGMPLPKEPGNEFVISDDGKPVSKEVGHRGNLRIVFEVEFVNYYEVLNVNNDVSDDELRRKYGREALRWRPDEDLNDRVEAEAKYKQIAEAYEVLSDPQKRAIYDQYGEEGLKQGPNAFIPRDAEVIFYEFIGKYGNNLGLGTSGPGKCVWFMADTGMPNNPPSKERKIPCSLEELYTGFTKEMEISRWVVDGSGKHVQESEMLIVDVMPGCKNGKKLIYREKGDHRLNKPPADIVYIIDEKPHDTFKRVGDDLIFNHTVSLSKALVGTTLNLKTLDGRDLRIRVSGIISPGHEHVVPNEGMPIPKEEPGNDGTSLPKKEPGSRGNLKIIFKVKFPTVLTKKKKDKLKACLGD